MKTIIEYLAEINLLAPLEALASSAPAAGCHLSLHRLGAAAADLAEVKGDLRRNDSGDLMWMGWGTVKLGHLTVTVYTSRPATHEDVLRMLPPAQALPEVEVPIAAGVPRE